MLFTCLFSVVAYSNFYEEELGIVCSQCEAHQLDVGMRKTCLEYHSQVPDLRSASLSLPATRRLEGTLAASPSLPEATPSPPGATPSPTPDCGKGGGGDVAETGDCGEDDGGDGGGGDEGIIEPSDVGSLSFGVSSRLQYKASEQQVSTLKVKGNRKAYYLLREFFQRYVTFLRCDVTWTKDGNVCAGKVGVEVGALTGVQQHHRHQRRYLPMCFLSKWPRPWWPEALPPGTSPGEVLFPLWQRP